MVGLLKALLPPLLLAAFAAAQDSSHRFNVTSPSSDLWWVAKSQNVMDWDCNSTQAIAAKVFTVLILSPGAAAALAIIAMQQNADCSKIITQDQANQPAGQGYLLLLANPANNTDVYATSEPFEIKSLGSQYPSQVTSSASAASGTAGQSSSPSASSTSAATLSSHSPSFFGLIGIMALLTVGLLGA